LFLWMLL